MRNFAELLRGEKFWAAEAEKIFDSTGIPAFDCILQIREEVVQLCQWIEKHGIQSYLELGVWTGRLISLLQQQFSFKLAAACDVELAKNFGFDVHLPPDCRYFPGNCQSPIYLNWRKKLGRFDLTLIDTDHSYESVEASFEINRQFGSKYIAIVGISPYVRGDDGARKFWMELQGTKEEILEPHSEIGAQVSTIGIGIWTV